MNDDLLINIRTDKGRYAEHSNKKADSWNAQVYAGDFEERERITTNFNEGESNILGKSPYPWQAWVTVDKSQWSWKSAPSLLSAQEIIIDLLKTIGDNGNYLINIGPRPDGTFEPTIVENMKQVGEWVKAHASAIYNTRGGDFVKENKYTSTKNGNTISLFVFDNALEVLELSIPFKCVNVYDDFTRK